MPRSKPASCFIAVALTAAGLAHACPADVDCAQVSGPFAWLERHGSDLPQRNALIVGTSSAAFALYGRAKWWNDGFGGGFKTAGEGWFGRGTDYGGADKLGHMFTTYATARLLATALRSASKPSALATSR